MPSHTASVPSTYLPPTWPGLYWPIRPLPSNPQYLYYTADIWRFTLYWTLLLYGAAHLSTAMWAVLMQLRSFYAHNKALSRARDGSLVRSLRSSCTVKETLGWVWLVPLVYCVVAGIEALLAGSVVGLILGAVYSAGYYKMSTWMPFIWGMINVLVLILASFSIQGGL